MAKFTATARDEVAASDTYAAPDRHATGVKSSVRVSPDDYSIWMVESLLEDGAELHWSAPHSDDGVYVIEGELDVLHDGTVRRCPTEGAIIVESDVECTARAIGPTRVLHAFEIGSRCKLSMRWSPMPTMPIWWIGKGHSGVPM